MDWLTIHKCLSQLASTTETLTLSQISGRDAILNAVQTWEHYINLHGSPGVGKTFLMHYLYYRADFLYFSDPTHYDASVSKETTVAIDNAPHTRQEARQLYNDIRWGENDYTGPRNVILITRESIDDAVRRIELTLTDADRTHIEQLIRQKFAESDMETPSQYDLQRSGLWWYVKTLSQRTE